MARPSVVNGFIVITKDHEGIVPWLYLDTLGLVTTGMGNLVEDRATGHALPNLFDQPWKDANGNLATRAQIQDAYDTVKARQDLAHLGGGNPAFAALTSIRLGPPGVGKNEITPEIRSFVEHVFANFEDIIKQGVPSFDSLPADAQLALMEHAWASGPSLSGWPALRAALAASPPDLRRAQTEDHQNGVTAQRETMRLALWQNAIDVQEQGLDFDTLFYPGTVANPSGPLPFDSGGGGGGSGGLNAALVTGGGKMSTGAKLAIGTGLGAIGASFYLGWTHWKGFGL